MRRHLQHIVRDGALALLSLLAGCSGGDDGGAHDGGAHDNGDVGGVVDVGGDDEPAPGGGTGRPAVPDDGFFVAPREAPPPDELAEEIARLQAIGYAGAHFDAPAASGVTVHDADRSQAGLNLVVSGHAPEAALIDMDGKARHVWRLAYADVPEPIPPPHPRHSGAWRRAYLYPNGDLLAIYEGLGLVKLNRDSEVLWYYAGRAHHDLEVLADGRIWVLTRQAHLLPRLDPERPILEDFATLLDADGNELRSISLIECFERSQWAPVVTNLVGNLAGSGDVFHTNTLEVLDGSVAERAPAFAAGNLLISLLHGSRLAVVDPAAGEVVWSRRGPWRRQHQPGIVDGRLMLFDNLGHGNCSRILELDPETLESQWEYAGDPPEAFVSFNCGAYQRLENGNTLIVESTQGRAFEVTRGGEIVWEYLNPHRGGEEGELIAVLFSVLRLPADFPLDWL